MIRDLELLGLVRVVVTLLLAASALTIVDLTLGTVVRGRHATRRRADTRAAYTALVSALGPHADPDVAVATLRGLPIARVEEALTVAARSIGGADADRVRAVAERLGVPDRARGRIGSRRWPRRLRAIRVLRATSSDAPAVDVLHDPVAEVRSAAVLWAGLVAAAGGARGAWTADGRPPIDLDDGLADALLDPSPLVRLAAKHAVTDADPPLLTAVERALGRVLAGEGPPLAALAPLACISASGRGAGVPLATIEPFLDDPEPRVRAVALRAVAAAAPERIPALCEDHRRDDAPVRAAVAEVAGRDLAAVGHLVDLAADPAWSVRQVARTSLRRAGPVGRALGRRVPRAPVAPPVAPNVAPPLAPNVAPNVAPPLAPNIASAVAPAVPSGPPGTLADAEHR